MLRLASRIVHAFSKKNYLCCPVALPNEATGMLPAERKESYNNAGKQCGWFTTDTSIFRILISRAICSSTPGCLTFTATCWIPWMGEARCALYTCAIAPDAIGVGSKWSNIAAISTPNASLNWPVVGPKFTNKNCIRNGGGLMRTFGVAKGMNGSLAA